MSIFKSIMKKAVGQDQHTDFSRELEWTMEPSKEELKGAIEDIEKKKAFVTWIQSFSKKTVTVVFGLYILCTLFSIVFMLIGCYVLGENVNMDIFITENNETFRVVIGGYLIKAGVENGIKIGGNYYLGISNARLALLKKKYDIDFETPSEDVEVDQNPVMATDEDEYRENASDT